jgi:hypothetical protein
MRQQGQRKCNLIHPPGFVAALTDACGGSHYSEWCSMTSAILRANGSLAARRMLNIAEGVGQAAVESPDSGSQGSF